MRSYAARIAQVAGWLSVVLIFGYHIALMALVGPPVSGTTDAAQIATYYGHGIIAPFGLIEFISVVTVLVFVVALRELLGDETPARLWATIAVGALIAEIPLIIAETSMQAALVTGVSAGSNLVLPFRFFDVLYNSGTYVLEATLLGAFALAFAASGRMPRWLIGLAAIGAVAQLVNASAIWTGMPNGLTLIGNVLFAVWFGGTSYVAGRTAVQAVRRQHPASPSSHGLPDRPAGGHEPGRLPDHEGPSVAAIDH